MRGAGKTIFLQALISPSGRARENRCGPVVLALLTVDGILSAILGALLLPTYVGAIPVPVSALACGLINAALVWAAGYWTESKRLAALPLWAWLATVAALALGGPGGDIIFAGSGIMAFSVLILLAFGAAPPLLLLRRMG